MVFNENISRVTPSPLKIFTSKLTTSNPAKFAKSAHLGVTEFICWSVRWLKYEVWLKYHEAERDWKTEV
jgi:hypothetical protein